MLLMFARLSRRALFDSWGNFSELGVDGRILIECNVVMKLQM